MRLIVGRSQGAVTGVLGGHKGVEFNLSYRLELTEEEEELVRRYKLEHYPLTWATRGGHQVPDDTIASMTTGKTITVDDVTVLVQNENTIKEACDKLPSLFEMCRTFGGEEVIEYPRQA